MTVAVVCPFFFCADPDRLEITRRIFRHYSTVPNITFIGVGSEQDLSRQTFAEYHDEANYREFYQWWDTKLPANGSAGLRRKFNEGINAAREYNPDFVYIVGSDDLLPAEYFVARDADLVGSAKGHGSGAYFWEYGDRNNAWWWDGESNNYRDMPFGCGALGFSTRLLDRLDWTPFVRQGDEYGVQGWALEQADLEIEAIAGLPGWHPKTDAVLNTITFIAGRHSLVRVTGAPFEKFLAYWDSLA
jgi:hypothetical protein